MSYSLFIEIYSNASISLTQLIFADDVFMFCKGDQFSFDAMMSGVDRFSKISGMVPNTDKSPCFFGNVAPDLQNYMLRCAGFQRGCLPIKYLGVPNFH